MAGSDGEPVDERSQEEIRLLRGRQTDEVIGHRRQVDRGDPVVVVDEREWTVATDIADRDTHLAEGTQVDGVATEVALEGTDHRHGEVLQFLTTRQHGHLPDVDDDLLQRHRCDSSLTG
jgi:hypothetical protein